MYVDPNISRNQPVAGRRIGRSCGCIIALSSLLFIVVALLVAGGIWWSSGVSLAGFELPEPLADLVRSNRLMSAPPVALVLEEDGALTGLALVNRPVGVRIERHQRVEAEQPFGQSLHLASAVRQKHDPSCDLLPAGCERQAVDALPAHRHRTHQRRLELDPELLLGDQRRSTGHQHHPPPGLHRRLRLRASSSATWGATPASLATCG